MSNTIKTWASLARQRTDAGGHLQLTGWCKVAFCHRLDA